MNTDGAEFRGFIELAEAILKLVARNSHSGSVHTVGLPRAGDK